MGELEFTMHPYRKLETWALVQKCATDDPLAWAEFITRFSKLAEKAILKRLKLHGTPFNAQDVDDIKQGFFTRLWQDKSVLSVRTPESVDFWLAMTAANYATNVNRTARKDILSSSLPLLEEAVNEKNASKLDEFYKSNLPSPREQLDAGILEKRAEDIFSSLNDNESVAVKLEIFEGLMHKEIAGIMNLSIGSVSSLIKRGKDKLRKIIKENA